VSNSGFRRQGQPHYEIRQAARDPTLAPGDAQHVGDGFFGPHAQPECPYLFQYRGRRIKSIRTGFEKARKDAGLDGKKEGVGKVIFHDSRRSAVTRMDELEIDREDAMEVSGHLTETMYKRYRIGKASKAVATGQKLRAAVVDSNEFANKFANRGSGAETGMVS
jgi:integrase